MPANKVDPSTLPPGANLSAQPINIGNAERRLITRAYFDADLQDAYNGILGPVQNGCGMPDGILITAFGVQAVLDVRPDFGAVQGDINNGFNEIQRESIMTAMKGEAGLSRTLAFSHTLMDPITYIGMGSGTNVVTASFRLEEGFQQGAIKASWIFALRANEAFQQPNPTLQPSGGVVTAIMDDNYTLGPPDVIFV